MFQTVLFPVDHSRETREASTTVLNIVKTYNSRLVILSVVEIDKEAGGAMASPEEVAKLLQGVQTIFAQEGVEAQIVEREGMPSFTICDVADEVDADLIIMGCRGLGLTNEGAAESVTARVINLSPCPVLVVP
jgi:nucleotide-binding universal stress UspA family protein